MGIKKAIKFFTLCGNGMKIEELVYFKQINVIKQIKFGKKS